MAMSFKLLSPSSFLRLPLETVSGESLYAEASGKVKKEAVVECALMACRMLDAEDVLRHSSKGRWSCDLILMWCVIM